MINECFWYLKQKSGRLLHFVQQTDIFRFLLLFEQRGVKILITSFWDTQYKRLLLRSYQFTIPIHWIRFLHNIIPNALHWFIKKRNSNVVSRTTAPIPVSSVFIGIHFYTESRYGKFQFLCVLRKFDKLNLLPRSWHLNIVGPLG